jgi:Lipid A 3-O-deacylase (PagL)
MRCLIAALLLAAAPLAQAGKTELGLSVGRSFDPKQTDVARLTWRQALDGEGRAWWWPQQLQYGVGVWRVPDLEGRTVRYDFSATPVWRRQSGFGYVEGGIGAYLLSATINNEENRLPSAFQFGSHIGAGVFVDKASLGVAVQHLSNARIKQPNGGINFLLVTLGVPF